MVVLLLVITVFPMASLHFYPQPAFSGCAICMQLILIGFPVADTKLFYFGNFITAAKTCTSVLTHCFKFLLGNSILAML